MDQWFRDSVGKPAVQAQFKSDLSLKRKGKVITRQQQLHETASLLELGERTLRILVDVIAIHQVGHAFLLAELYGFGDEGICRTLIVVLGHGQQLNDAGDLV